MQAPLTTWPAQVTLTLLVPSLLVTKVGTIMAEQHSLNLMSIPLVAALQAGPSCGCFALQPQTDRLCCAKDQPGSRMRLDGVALA